MAVCLLALIGLCIFFTLILLKWNQMRYARKGLPPGAMGWPLFGKTTQFLKFGPDFMKKQQARYGSLFNSHIFGCPTVISMDRELNRYILLNEGKGLVPGYPPSAVDILGKTNIAAVHGSTHKYIRGSFLSLIGPSNIKEQLLPKIDRSIRSFLANWDAFNTIDIQQKTKEMPFFILSKLILEAEWSSIYHTFKSEFDKLFVGTFSLPINFPGTNYHYALQGRKRVLKILGQIMKERRAYSTTQNDILGDLLRSGLSDEEIMDQVITILYSGYETVSTTTMMVIKYLHDHPEALQQIRKEHLAIRERKNQGEPIDWDDYTSLKFTRSVIYETLRLATVVNGVLRKTTEDVELDGFIIPKGWRIYVYTREINYDSLLYSEPLTFNPWRWLENNLENRNYCFLFGGGTRLCPGKVLGMVAISTFLHYFVTQYRWEVIGGEEILKFPRVKAPNGVHISVSKC